MEVLGVLLILVPILCIVLLAISAIPLYFTVKFFPVQENSFITALKVSFLAGVASIGVAFGLGVVGLIVPVLPGLLAIIAPFGIYVLLVQRFYALNLVESVIISVIQVIIGYILAFVMFLAILVPLGVGAAIFGGST